MAAARTVRWIERLTWVFIYGGLLALIIGISTQRTAPATGWGLVVAGGAFAALGAVLVWVRSRMREAAPSPAKETP